MLYDDPSIIWFSVEEFQSRQTSGIVREFASSRPLPSARRMGMKDDPPLRSLKDLDKPVKKSRFSRV